MMDKTQIAQYEVWLADFMDADVEHFQATRYTDNTGLIGYSGLSEWYSEDADSLATMGIQAWQAALAQGAEPVASDEPLSCPFCGDKPEWVKDDDPSWPQVQCKNLECPISHSDWISLDAWNRRAYTKPAVKVPEHVIRKCEQAIEYASEIRGGCISGVREGQKRVRAILSTPQQSDEWVRCENRLPIYPPDKLMRNMRDAHDYALNCKDDGIEGPAAIWSVQVYSAVRQWLLAQPSKDKQEGE